MVTDYGEAAAVKVAVDFVGTIVGPLPTVAKHRRDHGSQQTLGVAVIEAVFVVPAVGVVVQGAGQIVLVEAAAVVVLDTECDTG
jgi:hypothetical protein